MLKAIHRMQRDERGFTLVELLIVIAIIAILAAIAIPQFSQYRSKAAKAACQSDVKNCVNGAMAALADNPNTTSYTCPAGSNACGATPTATIANGTVEQVTVTGGGVYTGTCTYTSTTNAVNCT